MSERTASGGATKSAHASPLADAAIASRYTLVVSRGTTRLIDKYGADELAGISELVEQHVRRRDSYWVIDTTTGDRVDPKGLR